MTRFYIVFFLSCFLSACVSDAETTADSSLAPVSMECTMLEEVNGIPKYAVFVKYDEYKVKIAELKNCETFTETELLQIGLPKEASNAIGGLFVDSKEYVYTIKTKDDVTFWRATKQVGESDFLHRKIALFTVDGVELLRPANMAELAGYFSYQSPDTSYLLMTILNEGGLAGKLFSKAGEMPPKSELQHELPNFNTTNFFALDCSLNEMTCYSLIGSGELLWEKGVSSFQFSDFLGRGEEVVFKSIN